MVAKPRTTRLSMVNDQDTSEGVGRYRSSDRCKSFISVSKFSSFAGTDEIRKLLLARRIRVGTAESTRRLPGCVQLRPYGDCQSVSERSRWLEKPRKLEIVSGGEARQGMACIHARRHRWRRRYDLGIWYDLQVASRGESHSFRS